MPETARQRLKNKLRSMQKQRAGGTHPLLAKSGLLNDDAVDADTTKDICSRKGVGKSKRKKYTKNVKSLLASMSPSERNRLKRTVQQRGGAVDQKKLQNLFQGGRATKENTTPVLTEPERRRDRRFTTGPTSPPIIAAAPALKKGRRRFNKVAINVPKLGQQTTVETDVFTFMGNVIQFPLKPLEKPEALGNLKRFKPAKVHRTVTQGLLDSLHPVRIKVTTASLPKILYNKATAKIVPRLPAMLSGSEPSSTREYDAGKFCYKRRLDGVVVQYRSLRGCIRDYIARYGKLLTLLTELSDNEALLSLETLITTLRSFGVGVTHDITGLPGRYRLVVDTKDLGRETSSLCSLTILN
jgi:hypothetical protein